MLYELWRGVKLFSAMTGGELIEQMEATLGALDAEARRLRTRGTLAWQCSL